MSGLLIIIIAAFFIPDKCFSDTDYSYHGNTGPAHWADELHYSHCAGKLQSPIDIEEHRLQRVRFPPLIFRGFQSSPVSSTLTNNGHTVMLQVKMSHDATVSGGSLPGEFIFHQLHFHWGANDSLGSEDLINNQSFPMELHMVLYNRKYGGFDNALQFKDGLTVLAVFYDVFDLDNTAYADIVRHLDTVIHPHTEARLHSSVTLDDLLPVNKHTYYTYNGSLTTPPCSEVVTWIDFKEPISLSSPQIAAFRRLVSVEGKAMTENFRPVQPVGDRIVYLNVGERQLHHLSRYHHPGKGEACLHQQLSSVLIGISALVTVMMAIRTNV